MKLSVTATTFGNTCIAPGLVRHLHLAVAMKVRGLHAWLPD